MSTNVKVPSSLDAAAKQLGAIGKVVTAKNWERAAILAAYVQPDAGHGGRSQTARTSRLVSAREFASRGIHGLRSKDTVMRYVNAWLNERPRPEPGETVNLDGLPDWPPSENIARAIQGERREALIQGAETAGAGQGKVLDIAQNPKALRAAIEADENTAQAASEALINRELRTTGHAPMNPLRAVPDPRPDPVRYLDELRTAWMNYRGAITDLRVTDPEAAEKVDAQYRELLITMNVWANPVPDSTEGIDR